MEKVVVDMRANIYFGWSDQVDLMIDDGRDMKSNTDW